MSFGGVLCTMDLYHDPIGVYEDPLPHRSHFGRNGLSWTGTRVRQRCGWFMVPGVDNLTKQQPKRGMRGLSNKTTSTIRMTAAAKSLVRTLPP